VEHVIKYYVVFLCETFYSIPKSVRK